MFKFFILITLLLIAGFFGFLAFYSPQITQTEVTKDIEIVDKQ